MTRRLPPQMLLNAWKTLNSVFCELRQWLQDKAHRLTQWLQPQLVDWVVPVLARKHEDCREAIAQSVWQALPPDVFLQQVVTQVRLALGADRVMVYREIPDFATEAVAESMSHSWTSLMQVPLPAVDALFATLRPNDPDLDPTDPDALNQLDPRQKVWAIARDQPALADPQSIPHRWSQDVPSLWNEMLQQGQVLSMLIAPIVVATALVAAEEGSELKAVETTTEPLPASGGSSNLQPETTRPDGTLWGWLVVHQCHKFRSWRPAEERLVKQVATQVAIAMQQHSLRNQAQRQMQPAQSSISPSQASSLKTAPEQTVPEQAPPTETSLDRAPNTSTPNNGHSNPPPPDPSQQSI